ncbi:MAG: hypothetical protein HC896_06460 [Bacteroidales bacterium]|nr:hypothetical protein [Bacteroidales bacterium]
MRLLSIVYVLFCLSAKAQLSLDIPPFSAAPGIKSAVVLPTLQVDRPNETTLLAADKKTPAPYRYGIKRELNVSYRDTGLLEHVDALQALWRCKLKGEGAKSLGVTFSKFNVPRGAYVWIYSNGYKEVIGAFSVQNNSAKNN